METEEIQNSTLDTILQTAPIGGEENLGREKVEPTTDADVDGADDEKPALRRN
jgi:hypothetical protein